MAYGRGGAGNIQVAAQQKTKIADDIEANLQGTTSSPVTDRMATSTQQYALSGRGGAGNYYSPAQLNETGTFSGADRSHIVGDGTLSPAAADSGPRDDERGEKEPQTTKAPEISRGYGRGGAGNLLFGSSESEERAARQRSEDERRKEQLSVDIEKGVEETLAMPPRAKVPDPRSVRSEDVSNV